MKKIFFLFLIGLTCFLCSCSHFDIYEDVIYKTVEIDCQNEYLKSSATGTLISKDGLILTNKHVVKDFTTNSTIKARFINEEEYYAEIKYFSEEYDLCLLKIEKETEYFSSLSEEFADELEVGMKENGISGERIELTSKYSDHIYSNKFGIISENGYHTGIKIDNIVYDNLYPDGINYLDWLTDLGFTDYPEAFNLLEIIVG